MSDHDAPWGYARCHFGNPEKLYDYIAPFEVAVGDRVKVETRMGGWTIVTVAQTFTDSEQAPSAERSIIEKMPPPELEGDASGLPPGVEDTANG